LHRTQVVSQVSRLGGDPSAKSPVGVEKVTMI